MKTFTLTFGLLVLPLWLVGPATAAVDPAIIPADARWVVYADFNALRTSVVGKELVAAAENAQHEHHEIGLDMQKVLATVGAATAYGSNFSSDPNAIDGALVLQGTPDLRKIVESFLLQQTIAQPKQFSEVTDLPFPAYAIQAPSHDEKSKGELIVAFPPEPIVIASKSRPQLLKARDLFRGHGASMAQTPDAPLAHLLPSAKGAFAFATTVVPSDTLFPEDQPQARVLKMTRSGALAIGEEGGKTFARAELIANSDVMADKMTKILLGITAAMSLAETNDHDLSEFLNSASVTRENETVRLNLSYSSDRLAQLLHTFATAHNAPRPRTAEESAAAKNAALFNGTAVDQWQAQAAPAGQPAATSSVVWHTIEKVSLKNGAIISLGRQSRGGHAVRFDRVEIIPANGGTPLTFQTQYMTHAGAKKNFDLLQFPGADGTYTLKVAFVNDPEGKAVYTVSVREPKSETTTTAESKTE